MAKPEQWKSKRKCRSNHIEFYEQQGSYALQQAQRQFRHEPKHDGKL